MNKPSIITLFLLLMMSGSIKAQKDITFIQMGAEQVLQKGDLGYQELHLKRAPFTIRFKGQELMVCAGLEEELFEFAKPDTDINADFNSYFFIFKYLAASEDSEFLSIEKDTGNALNKSHGVKSIGPGLSEYTVTTLQKSGDDIPLANCKELYLALWLDHNKDQFIDKQELLYVKANFE